jgi:hypothetical protein
VSAIRGDFCANGSRFGVHETNRQIYPPPYYGRLMIVAMFNAGLHVWDIRDPYNPRRVAYFIQAPNNNTHTREWLRYRRGRLDAAGRGE